MTASVGIGKRNAEDCPPFGIVADLEASVMRRHDRAADRKAEAQPLFLRGEEGLKHAQGQVR